MRRSLGAVAVSCAAVTASNLLYSNSFGVPGINATYDYIVIGGGTSGNTIAARLAEDPTVSVAIIEAGSFYQISNGNGSVIPALCYSQFTGTFANDTQPLIDWGFRTTPQVGAAGREMHYARGRTLGGSSARNYMVYHRGTEGSYAKWADEVGDESYTFDNLLKYFHKSVHFTPPKSHLRFANSTAINDQAAWNNSLGNQPLMVSTPNYAYSLGSWAQIGMNAIGIKPSQTGWSTGMVNGSGWATSTIDPSNSQRSSSQTSFLDTAMKTTSLKVYIQSLAKRVLFNANKKAIGVLIDTAGTTYQLTAKKEVIISAGAFQSPQLLMVSGIGPKATLKKYNIPVLSNLPGVGQGMWDHPLFGISWRVNVITSSKSVNDANYAAAIAEEYLQNATGPLTGAPGMLGWERISDTAPNLLSNSTFSALSKFPADWPEIEYITQNAYGGYYQNSRNNDPKDGYSYGTLAAVLVSPTSRGNVTITSNNMADAPQINPGWLTTPEDADLAIAAFKRLRQIWRNMKNVTIGSEISPGAAVRTDAQILEHIRKSMTTVFHAAATCKMGRRRDRMAVVDRRARVFGVKGLRVVDASAFPFLPPGHPQASCYMLAEKIADDIKNGR